MSQEFEKNIPIMNDDVKEIAVAQLANLLKDTVLPNEYRDVLGSLSPNVRKRVDALRSLQRVHDEFEAQYFEERAALEAKYQKIYEPFYTKRSEIVNGITEVVEVANETNTVQGEEKSVEEKGVPNFWVTAMRNHEILTEEITDRDEGALKFLKDIKWTRIYDPKGFKLEFFFDTNPYFKNDVLTKTYHMVDEDEPILDKAIGTEIQWHPGKCLTQKILKKQRKKGSNITKPTTKTEKCDSFFNFFNPPEVPDDDRNLDDDAGEELQAVMEQDYEIASAIRDKIIPHAVSWFTGEAAEEDELDDDDEMDKDEDEVEDEDEDKDDDNEDEDEYEDEDDDNNSELTKNKKKEGGKAQSEQDQGGERPTECKQQ